MAEEVITPRTFKALVAEQKKTTIAIEKSMMSADVKLTSDAMKARDVNVLKGPKR